MRQTTTTAGTQSTVSAVEIGTPKSFHVLPADKNLVYNLRVNCLVRRFCRLNMWYQFRIGRIDLWSISKRHDNEILMISFFVGVHSCIVLSLTNWTSAVHQIDALHIGHKVQIRGAESAEIDPRFEIKTSKHVKHLRTSRLGLDRTTPINLDADLDLRPHTR